MRPVQDIMMHEGGAAVAGVALRAIWNRGPQWGWLGTGALLLVGIGADNFVRSLPMRRALEGVSAAAAANLGWSVAEKYIFGGGGVAIPARYAGQGYLQAPAQRALMGGFARGGVPMNTPIPENARRY